MKNRIIASELIKIAKDLLASKPIMKKKTKRKSRIGEITDFYYECEEGSFIVSYEPYGKPDSYEMVYLVHNFEAKYPLNSVKKEDFDRANGITFKDQNHAVKYAENLLKKVTKEAKDSDLGLAKHIQDKSGYWWD